MMHLVLAVLFLAPKAPVDVPLDGDANGLVWDGGALFVADFASNKILKWDGKTGFATVATIPSDGRNGLGAIARLPDGRLIVSRFGHGDTGGVFVVATDGTVSEVPKLESKWKRIGVAAGPKGEVYDAHFAGHGEAGAVARVSLDGGGETDVMKNLGKPVGVLVRGDWLYASDQGHDEIVRCKLPACEKNETVAKVESPDLLAMDGAGNLYTGTKSGDVFNKIDAKGKSESIAQGLGRVRGVAVDEKGRIFVAWHKDDKSFIRVIAP